MAIVVKGKKPQKEVTFTNSNVSWPSYSCLLFGQPGTGKTHFLGTISKVKSFRDPNRLQKVLVIDNDGGSLTLADNPNFNNINIVLMDSYEPYESLIEWLEGVKNPQTRPFIENLGDAADYDTIAIDNIGKLHWYIRRFLLEYEKQNRPHPEIVSLMDYRIAMEMFTYLSASLYTHAVKNNVSIFMTAHFKDNIDETTKKVTSRGPLIPGQLSQIVSGDFPLVGFLETSVKKVAGKAVTNYTAQFEPFDSVTLVKNRFFNKIPPMSDPSFQKLLNALERR